MQPHIAHKLVVDFLDNIYPTSTELRSEIIQYSKVILFPKRTILADIGHVHKNIYFILEGAVRTYYRDRNCDDITSWLLFEGDLAISVYSFYTQAPSFEAMQTVEDTWVLTLSYDSLMKLYKKYMEFNFIGRTLTESYYIKSEEKANALRMLSAKERYDQLVKTHPKILRRVPLGHIASYLGITSSTLSRIRGQK